MKHIFTETEFITLLALAGLTSAYAFERKEEVDDAMLVEALHSLSCRGQIMEKDDGFVPSGAIMEIVEAIRDADHVYLLELPETVKPNRLIYSKAPDGIIVMERSLPPEENNYKVQIVPSLDYIRDILDNELHEMLPPYGPSDMCQEELSGLGDADGMAEEGDEGFDLPLFILRKKELPSDEETVSLSIHMTASDYVIACRNITGIRKYPYTEKKFMELLSAELGGIIR